MPVKKVKTEKVVKAVKKEKTAKPKASASPTGGKKVIKAVKKEVHPVKSAEGGAKQFDRVKKEKVAKEIKVEKIEKVEKTIKKTNEKYFYAVGRRKTAVAQVRLFEDSKATDNDLIINGKKFKEYFPIASLQNNFLEPLKAVGMQDKVRMTVIVKGGGVTGQVEAVRLGVARALVEMDATLKKTLKNLGLMTRDSREVERKKPGLKKARKAPQWAKR
jgi:small subunit ribosomal protein S9